MKKCIALIALLLFLLTGCGLVNNFGVIGKNLSRGLTPHAQAVDAGKEEEVLASGMAIVDINFGNNVGTAWRRVAPDGSIEETNYYLTYNELGTRGRRVSQLLPGTYFLNGVVVSGGGMSGYYARSIGVESFGWNEDAKEARCFSFTVKAGQFLLIPDISVNYDANYMNAHDTICPALAFKEPASAESYFYKVGPESKRP